MGSIILFIQLGDLKESEGEKRTPSEDASQVLSEGMEYRLIVGFQSIYSQLISSQILSINREEKHTKKDNRQDVK